MSSKAIPYKIIPHKPTDTTAAFFCALICLLIIIFFGVSLYASLVRSWPYNMNLSFQHYDFSRVAGGTGTNALPNSLLLASFAAVFGTAVTYIAAYISEKVRILSRLRKLIYFFAISPMAIPGTVIGLSYILFFNPVYFRLPFGDIAIVNSLNPLYGTMGILIISTVIHYFSVPFITAVTALKSLDSEFETVSESLNVPFYKTLVRVTVPISFKAILEIAIYYFVNAMITVSALVFLYTPATRVASVTILNIKDAGDIAPAAAMSVIILFINIFARLLYELSKARISKRTDGWRRSH